MQKDSPFFVSGVHHIAIICSDYPASKRFYTEILGFETLREVYREERDSWKLDLKINGLYQIELFSFPNTPPRPSRPEACGLRHLALKVSDIESAKSHLESKGVLCEDLRVDPHTGKRFTFFSDPDDLPIEFYED
ncbi:VOC family protein [uncultured Imperialibacter sp.]|uniref:SMU1112c/YaeR family gloxylase I-like metalloprotein n=1 Tax=uncultured Imperialibacter sp. TaxID=1672639 RepID=UPI0030D9F313|tara:strand:- start:3 stop:407 length:405 start_codon:yes stop_codon:yes gene_type:complete